MWFKSGFGDVAAIFIPREGIAFTFIPRTARVYFGCGAMQLTLNDNHHARAGMSHLKDA